MAILSWKDNWIYDVKTTPFLTIRLQGSSLIGRIACLSSGSTVVSHFIKSLIQTVTFFVILFLPSTLFPYNEDGGGRYNFAEDTLLSHLVRDESRQTQTSRNFMASAQLYLSIYDNIGKFETWEIVVTKL